MNTVSVDCFEIGCQLRQRFVYRLFYTLWVVSVLLLAAASSNYVVVELGQGFAVMCIALVVSVWLPTAMEIVLPRTTPANRMLGIEISALALHLYFFATQMRGVVYYYREVFGQLSGQGQVYAGFAYEILGVIGGILLLIRWIAFYRND